MNTLEEKLQKDLVEAMKNKESVRVSSIRSIKTEIQNEKTKGVYHELSDSDIVGIIQKLSKRRQESADIYILANRNELAEQEVAEKSVLDEYLPKMLSEEELTNIVDEIISELNVKEPRQMGIVIKTLKERYNGQYDGAKAANIVKSKLN